MEARAITLKSLNPQSQSLPTPGHWCTLCQTCAFAAVHSFAPWSSSLPTLYCPTGLDCSCSPAQGDRLLTSEIPIPFNFRGFYCHREFVLQESLSAQSQFSPHEWYSTASDLYINFTVVSIRITHAGKAWVKKSALHHHGFLYHWPIWSTMTYVSVSPFILSIVFHLVSATWTWL